MTVPVANDTGVDLKRFNVKFPGWWLRNQEKIARGDYNDIRVTTSADVELPIRLNSDKDAIMVEYDNMPLGRQELYVYYGNASASAPTDVASTSLTNNVQVMDANDEEATSGGGNRCFYLWGDDVDEATLDSGATGTYKGSSSTYDVGYNARKYHYLVKYFEGALPKGTVDSANLNLYFVENGSGASNGASLKVHKVLTQTSTSPNSPSSANATGWCDQEAFSMPTWNTKATNGYGAGGSLSWYGSAGSSTLGTDISNTGDEPTITLDNSYSSGYRSVTIPTQWLTDWISNTTFSNGILIKDSTEGTNNRHALISSTKNGAKAQRVVFEVYFSSIDADQFAVRKISTNGSTYSIAGAFHKFSLIPSENSFNVILAISMNYKIDIVYCDTGGRIYRVAKNLYKAGTRLDFNAPSYGIFYDYSEKVFWTAGTENGGHLYVGYASHGNEGSWTFATHPSEITAKSEMVVKNGVSHIVHANYVANFTRYLTYTKATGSWSSTVDLVTVAISGTMRSLASSIGGSDVLDGTGTVATSGSLADYPPSGVFKVDSELFYYSGKSGSSFTGVLRAVKGTSAASHSAGASMTIPLNQGTYITVSHDTTDDILHVIFHQNVNGTGNGDEYTWLCYMRHSLNEAANVWRKEDGQQITLPMNNQRLNYINQTGYPTIYHESHICTSDGYVYVLYKSYGASGATIGTMAMLPKGSSTWSHFNFSPYTYFSVPILEIADGSVCIIGTKSKEGTSGATLVRQFMVERTEKDDNVLTQNNDVIAESWSPYVAHWVGVSVNPYFSGKNFAIFQQHTNYGTLYAMLVSFSSSSYNVVMGGVRIVSETPTSGHALRIQRTSGDGTYGVVLRELDEDDAIRVKTSSGVTKSIQSV